ncbi:hypothetical protein H4582DRAFT_1978779 [Lactarius indigo]|nr:hypothetical protein H4582DRAFT_1978779 [Lactarius indigo]
MTSDIVAVVLWCFFHLSASADGSDPERTRCAPYAVWRATLYLIAGTRHRLSVSSSLHLSHSSSTTFAMILDVRLAHCAIHPISSCLRSSRGWRLHRPSWVRGCTYVSEVSRTLI